MDETSLFWKKILSRMYMTRDETSDPIFKTPKDRVTFIMCGNVVGFMGKLRFLNKSANAWAFKIKIKTCLSTGLSLLKAPP